MCKCNPSIRTPYCGKGDCVWPKQTPLGIPTPDDLEEHFKTVMHPEVEALEARIVARLQEGFKSSHEKAHGILMPDFPFPDSHVQTALQNAFSKAGWTLEFTDDQRDGTCLTIKVGPRTR